MIDVKAVVKTYGEKEAKAVVLNKVDVYKRQSFFLFILWLF